jgi:hypothetical protein
MTGKRFRVLLAERAPGEAADSLRALYPRPALRLSVGYWGANDTRTFSEFLDAVESELRRPQAVPARLLRTRRAQESASKFL